MNAKANHLSDASKNNYSLDIESLISERIHGINLNQYFPLPLKGHESVSVVSYLEASQFIQENHRQIFEQEQGANPFLSEKPWRRQESFTKRWSLSMTHR